MKRILRISIIGLFAIVVLEAYFLWFNALPSIAQDTGLFGRPYYGAAINNHSARFDHRYPNYGAEGGANFDNLLKEDGGLVNEASLAACPTPPPNPLNSCYSGHDGRDFPMAYKPVVSAATGIVKEAGWHNIDHTKWLGLRMEVEHEYLGATWRSVYGHLSSIRYLPTTFVGRWQIGTAGTSGNSNGPHLHFQVMKWMSNQWKVADPYGGPTGANTWQNLSGVTSIFMWLPENQRETPLPPRYTQYIMDEDATGSTQWCLSGASWSTPVNTSTAYNNDLRWTFSNGLVYDCQATWGGAGNGSPITLLVSGLYEVEVHIPVWGGLNRSNAARYTINFPGGSNTVTVDQSQIATSEWISLGRYTFSQGQQLAPYVQVKDNSNIGGWIEPADTKQILVDAVRLVSQVPQP